MSKKIRRLDLWERQVLYLMREKGSSIREIAKTISRSVSTVNDELKRNRHWSPSVWRRMNGYEKAKYADDQAKKRRAAPRNERELLKSEKLRNRVIQLLVEEQAAPLDISLRIPEEFPGESISPRAIYNFIKKNRPDLKQYLRIRGKPRRQRVVQRRSRFKAGAPEKKRIDTRPESVETREEIGHYEADTVVSCKHGSGNAVLTIIERSSRKRFYFWIPNLEAATVLAVLLPFFRALPASMRKTLTVDNGSEFASLHQLEVKLGRFKVYHCYPYRAWERGSVERSNRELRWYFPKGTDFASVSRKELGDIEARINRRRMPCLQKKSAQQVFEQALAKAV
jgi:transposase, IS30 family